MTGIRLAEIAKRQAEIGDELLKLNKLEQEINQKVNKTLTPARDDKEKVLDKNRINEIIEQLALQVISAYELDQGGEAPLLVTLMDGALFVTCDLIRSLAAKGHSLNYTSLTSSSYSGTTRGEVKLGQTKASVCGRNVLLVDELVDSGKTAELAISQMRAQHVTDVKFLALLNKMPENADIKRRELVDFCGTEINPDAFIVGCGLDYSNSFRGKDGIYDVNTAYIATDEESAQLKQRNAFSIELTKLDTEKQDLLKLESSQRPTHSNSFFTSGHATSPAQPIEYTYFS